MRILNPQSTILSNHEVLLHVQAEHAEYTSGESAKHKRKPPGGLKAGLEEMLRDTLQYLGTPDYAVSDVVAAHPARPMTLYKGPHSLLRVLAPRFRLNKAEYLQIYNIRPRSRLMLDCIIEEASSRFSDEQLEEMLDLINGVFDEEEAQIPKGVENQQLERLPSKMLGAKKRKVRRKV